MPSGASLSTKPTTCGDARATLDPAARSEHHKVVPSSFISNRNNKTPVTRRDSRNTPTSSPFTFLSTAVTRLSNPTYGELVDSGEVHNEIRALGTEVKAMVAQHLPCHGTSEEQITWGVSQFGPSKESRAVLNRENEAARLAWEGGVYCVWRCTATPKLHGANNDFCCRLGYRHVCFCGHNMAAHKVPLCAANTAAPVNVGRAPVKDRQLAQWKAPCEDVGCSCGSFRYIPNTPLEIGEGWLTRRANFKISEWSAKCICGHGHKVHDPSSYLRCRSCAGCPGFTSSFLCVVCDLPWEAHETVWESEGARLQAGLPVREAYSPLSGVDWDVRQLVLKDATMGGKIEPPARYLAFQGLSQVSSSSSKSRSPRRRISGGCCGDSVAKLPAVPTTPGGDSEKQVRDVVALDPVLVAEYCPACATIYRSVASNFCSKCGHPRQRRPTTLC